MHCLLCQSPRTQIVWTKPKGPQKDRTFVLCETCLLIFVPPAFHLGWNEQKSVYDFHQNSPESAGYIQHLKRLTNPLQKFLRPNACGLDYGSGPGPTLAGILQERGFDVKNYDPLYEPNPARLQTQYDFATCTEVVEHFTKPAADWQSLIARIRSKGILGVMTQFRPDVSDFPEWWYHRDATHICFYHPKTWNWLAKRFDLEIVYQENPVVIFCRQ